MKKNLTHHHLYDIISHYMLIFISSYMQSNVVSNPETQSEKIEAVEGIYKNILCGLRRPRDP